MNLLNTLTRAADEEQLRLHPLPAHAAASQAEHLRRHYALLLAAVLTAQPAVSEPQTRLLRLLLDALALGDIRAALFEQARALEPEPLLEAARLIREAGFAHHLMVDVLVLLRLDAQLSDEAAQLASELAAFLGLNQTELAMRAQNAADILGLNADTNTDDNNDSETEAPTAKRFSLAEIWPTHLSQPLTAKALRSGLQGDAWVLDDDLDVDFPWQANGAIFFFRNGATLNTFANAGEIKLTDCRLVDASLRFQGACNITLARCDWQGDYSRTDINEALMVVGSALTVTDCQFSTLEARAITVNGNRLTLQGSRFTDCGHAEWNGGAVWHSDHFRTIENCRFDRCRAARGGALWVNKLYGVNNCEFVACESLALKQQDGGDIAFFARENHDAPVITNCVFRHTSLYVGTSFNVNVNRIIARHCQFIHGNLYYLSSSLFNNFNFNDGGTFESGRVIHKQFE